jgi:hypothetical protein
MINAPFTGTDAASTLLSLGVIFIAFGGIALMLRFRRFAARALALGTVVSLLAGFAPQVFR